MVDLRGREIGGNNLFKTRRIAGYVVGYERGICDGVVGDG